MTQMALTDLYADIYDIIGKKVYAHILDGKAGTFTYSINDLDLLTWGGYHLVVHDLQNLRVQTGKFIIMN